MFCIMFQKITLLFLLFICLLTQSCYTIGYPTPCPGLVENVNDVSDELSLDITD